MRENFLTRFRREPNLADSVEENASVYLVYPVSRITGEGRGESLQAWEHGVEPKGARGGRFCQLWVP